MPEAVTVELVARRYVLDRIVGSGGFGEVWRATDSMLSRQVAVKVLRPEFAREPDASRLLRTEAQRAASLEHPAIVRIYDYDEESLPGRPYLVMEYVDGPSLATVLHDGPLRPARVLDLVAQIAAGLDAAHRAGVTHRDIKAANVLLSSDGQVKITDFGISTAAGSGPVTATGLLVGTPEYLAPERANGVRGDPRSDLYSLGILAYKCLTGGVPFTGQPVEVLQAHRNLPLPALPNDVPAEIGELVARLTAKDPQDRPGSAAEVAMLATRLRDPAQRGIAAGQRAAATAGPRTARTAGRALAPPGLSVQARTAQPPAEPTWAVPRRPATRRARSAGLLAAAVGLGAVAWLIISILIPAGHPNSPARAADLVHVNAAALRGGLVRTVRAKLRRMGLSVRLDWRPTTRMLPRHVLSVQPGGWLPQHSRVVVVGALPPANGASAPAQRQAAAGRGARPGHRRIHDTQRAPKTSRTPALLPSAGPSSPPADSSAPTPPSTPSGTPTPTPSSPTASPQPTPTPTPTSQPAPVAR